MSAPCSRSERPNANTDPPARSRRWVAKSNSDASYVPGFSSRAVEVAVVMDEASHVSRTRPHATPSDSKREDGRVTDTTTTDGLRATAEALAARSVSSAELV